MDHALSRGRGDAGAVLVVAVLLSLALLGLAHALLVSAESAYVTSRARARFLRLEAHATGVMERESRAGWRPWMDSVTVGGLRTGIDTAGGPTTTITWRRVRSEAWLASTLAQEQGPRAGLSRLLWIYDPATRVGALPGVVSVATGVRVDGQASIRPDTVPTVAVLGPTSLGRWSIADLLAAVDESGPVARPRPSAWAGRCLETDPSNWGDPGAPPGPCSSYFVARGSDADLTIDGGSGQGVLVVDGDLRVQSGADFQGLVIVAGTLVLQGSATLRGRVLALGDVTIEAGSAVIGSYAAAERALTALRPTLGDALPLHPARRFGER